MYCDDEFKDFREFKPRHRDDNHCQECGEELSIEGSYYINELFRLYVLKCDNCHVKYLAGSNLFDPRRIFALARKST